MKQQKKQTGIIVFYSYASVDRELRDQLANHLSQLKRDGLIEEWHDQQILAGSDRAQAIDQAIHSAHIILLFISADFLASDTCYQVEMQQALKRHQRGEARIVPVIVRPCDWQHSPFAHLQCLPRNTKPITTWGNQDEAFVAIAKELRKIIAQQQFPDPLLSDTQRWHRTRLLKRVRTTWIEDLLEQSLHRSAWIDLHLQEQPDALENPWRFQVQELDQAPCPLPDGTSIVQVYDEADGELLLLGEPGSGKTTLLLQLVQTLLERAQADESHLLPVIFNLSTWAQRRLPLAQWLILELKEKYRIPSSIGRSWVEHHQLLLLLDGLDEVAGEARLACVQAITAHHQQAQGHPLVLTCRSQEYAELTLHLPFNAAIRILPLSNQQLDAYLSHSGDQGKAFRHLISIDTEFAALAHNPLMLNIATLAYQGKRVVNFPAADNLPSPDNFPVGASHEQLLQIVFTTYVEQMLTRRGTLPSWMRASFPSWLCYLARQLHQRQQTIFAIEDLQPDWLPVSTRIFYRGSLTLLYLLFFLVFGLFFGLPVGLFFSPPIYAPVGPFSILLTGPFLILFSILSYGLLLGVFCIGFYYFSDPESRRSFNQSVSEFVTTQLAMSRVQVIPIWSRSKRVGSPTDIGFVLGAGSLCGLLVGMAASLRIGASGLLIGLLTFLVFAVVYPRLSSRVSFQEKEKQLIVPNEGIWRSAKRGALVLLFSILLVSLLGLYFGLNDSSAPLVDWARGPAFGLVFGLSFGLILGLCLGLTVGLLAFLLHFVVRFWLWRSHVLPWKLVPFLDEATTRLLLRKLGGSYIFVHRLLLEYFATLDEPVPTKHASSENKRVKSSTDVL